jgi:hypothetical protein
MIRSKLKQRIVLGIVKIVPALMTYFFSIQSCLAQANHEHDQVIHSKVVSWEDSLSRLKPRNRPVYLGFDVSMGAPQYRIASNIDVLNDLHVSYFGGMAGGVIANPIGKIKSGIGIYYSGENVPYTFDLITANISANLYLLRIKQVRYHTVEPYLVGSASQMKNKFYGYYLSDPSAKINRSISKDPYIGSVISTQLLIGAGKSINSKTKPGTLFTCMLK